jgi:hypothetical protein
MILSGKPYKENEYVKLGTYNFEIVKDYAYLGTFPTNTSELRPEIKKKITYSNGAYYRLFPLLKNTHPPQKKNRKNKNL